MTPEKLIEDKNFISAVLKSVPWKISNNFSKDEIKSELYMTLCICCKNYDPMFGKLKNYVVAALCNNLISELKKKEKQKAIERPLEYAENLTYTLNFEDSNFKEYIKGLPQHFVEDLTKFALGKIKKEDLLKPSYGIDAVVLERILRKIDSYL